MLKIGLKVGFLEYNFWIQSLRRPGVWENATKRHEPEKEMADG